MPIHTGKHWGLVVAAGLVSATGCNAVLGNEEGHLPADAGGAGGTGAAHSGGAANASGTTGKGGKGSGGAATATGGAAQDAGAPGTEAGAGGEESGGSGGSVTQTGGVAGRGGTFGSGGAIGPSSGGKASGGANTGGQFTPPGGAPGSGGSRATGGANTGGQFTPPGGGPSTGGAPSTCTTADPSSCPSTTTVRYCEAGSYRTVSCATRCTEIGFVGTGAMCSSSYCMCGASMDPVCEQGMINYCSCAPGGCTAAQANAIYISCYQHGPTEAATRCWERAPNCVDGAAVCGT